MPAEESVSDIQILINGETHFLEAGQEAAVSLPDLLKKFRIEMSAVAVAINDEIIPPSARSEVKLRAGDRLEIVRAVAGG